MIRFFRSIRQQLMNENKTAKYLKYAVGEVLLVMIGILLALQVNNWNEGRKVEQQRLKLIENLQSDFQTNLERLDEVIADVEEVEESLKLFLGNTAGNSTDLTVEELKKLAGYVRHNNPFEPSLGFYRAAISTGSIALLEGSRLNNLFTQFERHNNRLQDFDYVAFEHHFEGSGLYMDIRRQLGDANVLFEIRERSGYIIPEAYRLSDEEYRQFIARKEVYAYFDMRMMVKHQQFRRLNEMKVTGEEILAELEAL